MPIPAPAFAVSALQAHILIFGRSRFPMAALLLSHSCTEALHLYQDKRCARRRTAPSHALSEASRGGGVGRQKSLRQLMRAESTQLPKYFDGSRRVHRCFGTGNAYAARTLQDEVGRLQQDGMLSYF